MGPLRRGWTRRAVSCGRWRLGRSNHKRGCSLSYQRSERRRIFTFLGWPMFFAFGDRRTEERQWICRLGHVEAFLTWKDCTESLRWPRTCRMYQFERTRICSDLGVQVELPLPIELDHSWRHQREGRSNPDHWAEYFQSASSCGSPLLWHKQPQAYLMICSYLHEHASSAGR